ncbi:heterogeneous nuclear ribonucleoprotein A3-like protein 1-like [Forsythia ovata]|uniref:Heterogeneous nuclear ribonucleoprotein A3-like protein 1-like n=1 Tax=Forsythia ovata TaxID=205694 RepID=A0ABD1X6M6_9LAMI
MKEDKRKSEEAEEKQVGTKKQKNDAVAAVEEQKIEFKTSETDQEHKVPKSNVLVPPEKELMVAAENFPVALIEKKIKSDDDSILEDETSGSVEYAGAPEKVPGTTTENDLVAATEKNEDASNCSGSVSEDEDVAATKNILAAVPSVEDATATKKEGECRREEESEEAEPSNAQGIKKSISVSDNSSSSEVSSEEDQRVSTDKEAEDPSRNPEKMDTDVKMMDATLTTENSEKGGSSVESPKTPATLRVQTTGSKTLFIGNLSFSIERADVEDFFKDAGELVDVRFAMNQDDTFRGFGHIEFASAEAAEKAIQELNGKHLLGRRVRLDFTREKGSYTPHSGTETSLNQTGGRAQGHTIFVRGFDKRHGEDEIRSALGDHFVSCGEITKISIPKDQDGGVKGIAYIDFKDADAFNNALELNGSEFGEDTLMVEGAKPRGEGRDNAWSGRSGGRFGSRRGGGHFGGGGRGYGGHFGGGGRGYGDHFGGGGRGYGGHFGGGDRGYGGHFGGGDRGYGGHFGGGGRGYGGRFGGGGRGW